MHILEYMACLHLEGNRRHLIAKLLMPLACCVNICDPLFEKAPSAVSTHAFFCVAQVMRAAHVYDAHDLLDRMTKIAIMHLRQERQRHMRRLIQWGRSVAGGRFNPERHQELAAITQLAIRVLCQAIYWVRLAHELSLNELTDICVSILKNQPGAGAGLPRLNGFDSMPAEIAARVADSTVAFEDPFMQEDVRQAQSDNDNA